jgi:hypothetical protein
MPCPSRTPGNETGYLLYMRLGGPQGQSGCVHKNSPPPGFNPFTILPVVSHYWPCCPGPQHRKYEIKIYSCNLERTGCGDSGHTQKSSVVILECLNSCGYHMYLQDYGVNFSMSEGVSFLGLWYKRVKLCFCVLVCMPGSTHTQHTHTHTRLVWFHNVTWMQFGFVCCICLVLWQSDIKTGFKPWHRDKLSWCFLWFFSFLIV